MAKLTKVVYPAAPGRANYEEKECIALTSLREIRAANELAYDLGLRIVKVGKRVYVRRVRCVIEIAHFDSDHPRPFTPEQIADAVNARASQIRSYEHGGKQGPRPVPEPKEWFRNPDRKPKLDKVAEGSPG